MAGIFVMERNTSMRFLQQAVRAFTLCIIFSTLCFISVSLTTCQSTRATPDKNVSEQRCIWPNAKTKLGGKNSDPKRPLLEVSSCPQHKHHFVFIKIHKTGSTTITTMLERYGYRRDLNFAVPRPIMHFFPRNKKFSVSLVYQWDLKDAKGVSVWPALGGFHALVNHARYDRAEHSKLVPGAIYFTMIREPVARFGSFFRYFMLGNQVPKNASFKDSLAVFLQDPERYSLEINSEWIRFFQNGQLYMLGLEPEAYDNLKVVDETIASLSQNMDLVMINEYFDESLILLKKLMCWDMQDIIYISKAVQKRGVSSKLSTAMQRKILVWNRADWKLYQHFNKTFWDKVSNYGPQFHQDLKAFRQMKAAAAGTCLKKGTLHLDATRKFTFWKAQPDASEKCKDLMRADRDWVSLFRKRMDEKSQAFVKYRKG